jgi:glutamate:GABA antiporter
MSATNAPVEEVTAAAAEETAKLRRHFGRFDVFFFLICTLVGLDTIGAVAAHGGQGFTWLIFLAIFFFAPYAMLTSELGTAFPDEGGPYVWTRMAFGRFVGAVNSIIYWISNPIWLGGSLTITAITVFGTFFTPLTGVSKWIFAIGFIWLGVWSAIMSFDKGKWLPTIGGFSRILLMSFFVLSVIVYAIKNGVHGIGGGDFKPSYAIFIALVPVLIFNYVGFELPSTAGEEMKNPRRDVPFAILRSGIGTVLLYGVPVLAILLVLPLSQVTSLTGFVTAIQTVFTVWGGHVSSNGTATLSGAGQVLGDLAAIGFIAALLTSGSAWIMGADRAQAVACYDGAGPRFLGSISARFGTPVRMNVTSGIMATLVFVMATEITSGNGAKYFTVVLSLAISTTTIAYLAIFPALWKLRRSHPEVPRPYSVPGGMTGATVVSLLTTGWALLATIALLWPGFGTSNPDASLPAGFAGQRLQFELSQFIPLIVLFALGCLFYVLGGKTRSHLVKRQIPVGTEAADVGVAVA